MISLTCANCRATLEVDDAFAGGVCRCQHCGTIQTVPRPSNRPAAPGLGEAPKALYQVKQRSGTSSNPSGLEELAEVVHSSGLSGSGLINRTGRPAAGGTHKPAKPKSNPALLWAGVGGVTLLLVVAVTGFLLLSKPAAGPTAGGGTAQPAGPQAAAFDTVALSGEKVIFVLDRGDATAAFFPALKKLTTDSVKSLGEGKRFAVILWSNGNDDAYPRVGTATTTAAEAGRLGRWFDEVATGRTTDVQPAMAAAMAQSPDEIVVHAVSLGEPVADDPMKKIALESGGTYKYLSTSELNNIGG